MNRFFFLKNMSACTPTTYRTGESFFECVNAWAPSTFSIGGCEKSLFENHGCQDTHDVRTVSFFMMYGEG